MSALQGGGCGHQAEEHVLRGPGPGAPSSLWPGLLPPGFSLGQPAESSSWNSALRPPFYKVRDGRICFLPATEKGFLK